MRPWIPIVGFLLATGAQAASLGADHYQTGLAYERLGRFQDAYTELQLASNLNPDDTLVATALGLVAARLGNGDEAIRALEHSIALDANSNASYFLLALLYEQKNATERAAEAWNRFLVLSQDESLQNMARKHLAYLRAHP